MKLISIATFTLLSSTLALACGSPSEGGGTGESSSSGSSSSDGSMTAGSATLSTTTMTSMTASTTTDATTDATTTDAPTTSGVDSSGDATAGTTDTGTDSSGGSSSGGTTGGDPGAYGPCDFSMGDPVCPDGEQCAVLPDGQHWCGLPCDQDPDPCPEVPSGDAAVECSGFYMQCALECTDNACPDGMECVEIMNGPSRCGWPAPE